MLRGETTSGSYWLHDGSQGILLFPFTILRGTNAMVGFMDPTPSADSRYPADVREAISRWAGLTGKWADLDRVVILKECGKSRVYRLPLVGPGGAAVIAKRHSHERNAEEIVLERISGDLPGSVPKLFASDSRIRPVWHFVEDAGSDRFHIENPLHVDAIVDWLSRLHSTPLAHLRTGLPGRGPRHYREHLVETQLSLRLGYRNPSATADEARLFRHVDERLEDLLRGWDLVAQVLELLPRTVVHGDLQPKNILMRMREGRNQAVVLDWEMGGWGNPAVDLAALVDWEGSAGSAISKYWELRTRSILNEVDRNLIVLCGSLLRSLTAMNWATRSLRYPRWGSKPVRRLLCHSADAVRSAVSMGLSVGTSAEVPCPGAGAGAKPDR